MPVDLNSALTFLHFQARLRLYRRDNTSIMGIEGQNMPTNLDFQAPVGLYLATFLLLLARFSLYLYIFGLFLSSDHRNLGVDLKMQAPDGC